MRRQKFSYREYVIRALTQGFLWACVLVILNHFYGWVR